MRSRLSWCRSRELDRFAIRSDKVGTPQLIIKTFRREALRRYSVNDLTKKPRPSARIEIIRTQLAWRHVGAERVDAARGYVASCRLDQISSRRARRRRVETTSQYGRSGSYPANCFGGVAQDRQPRTAVFGVLDLFTVAIKHRIDRVKIVCQYVVGVLTGLQSGGTAADGSDDRKRTIDMLNHVSPGRTNERPNRCTVLWCTKSAYLRCAKKDARPVTGRASSCSGP